MMLRGDPAGRDEPSSRPRRDSLLRRIAAMRIASTERHWQLMPAELARRNRANVVRVADGLSTLMAKSDALRMNRVVGLGHRGLTRPATVDALIERYRAARIKRFSVLLETSPQSAEITRWLLERGFERRPGHVLLLRDGRLPIPRSASELRVARARGPLIEAVVRIHGEVFATAASQMAWALAAAAAPDNEHYVAFVGSAPAGVGSLRSAGSLAWLGGGATRTCWRRRGVQSALIAARLRRAQRLGCRWAWSEAIEPRAGRPDGSRRNLMRMGFVEIGTEPLFVWQSRGAS